ncbi:diguanylate cyclase domain-containing protein [Deinococcus cellulosilyticus]|uniref:GGDEF domain-containing protein n=1 Tax=Deinococcus cellulosilyticus (strain DSM 18568 / NBRC 106333 / KACC 11606 / 5516J-15) TaxID=1223518 RepID=A0A511N3D4_DEIC1|nr:diguanylate cyclase [Deinococcus cellulosilyticus]GEM46901.1 hypothetical protein DC3_25360 [Deinococcus cellulosilyticus NBRC 106333 = KACC 11606]
MPDASLLEKQYQDAHTERDRVMLLLHTLPGLVEAYHPQAAHWVDVALESSKQVGLLAEHAELLRLNGVLCLYRGQNMQAYQHMLEALQYARDLQLNTLQAEVYRWLGNACTGMGHFHEALSWFEEGLSHTSAHALTVQHVRIQAGMCWLYRHNNEPAQTIENARQVTQYACQNGLHGELAFVYANVLEAHLDLYEQEPHPCHLESAEVALESFRRVMQQNPSERLKRFELYLLTKLTLARKDLEAAEKYIQDLLERLGEKSQDTLYGDAHLDLVVVRGLQGRWSEALHHLSLSRQNFEQARARYGVMLTLRQEADLLEKKGDFQAALTAFKRYHQAFESQERQRAREKSQMLGIKLQVEEIHHELLQLRTLSRQLEEQNAALHQKTHTLAQEALIDTLTGLPNRRAFNDRFARMIRDMQQQPGPLGVVVLDIDHFKQVNDRYSHETGDRVLTVVGGLLEQHCRGQDFVARWGGEEFVVLLPGLDERTCHQVCERLRRTIEDHDWAPYTPGKSVTVSVGFAVGHSDLETLFREADHQLYTAKHAGRNTVRPDRTD